MPSQYSFDFISKKPQRYLLAEVYWRMLGLQLSSYLSLLLHPASFLLIASGRPLVPNPIILRDTTFNGHLAWCSCNFDWPAGRFTRCSLAALQTSDTLGSGPWSGLCAVAWPRSSPPTLSYLSSFAFMMKWLDFCHQLLCRCLLRASCYAWSSCRFCLLEQIAPQKGPVYVARERLCTSAITVHLYWFWLRILAEH